MKIEAPKLPSEPSFAKLGSEGSLGASIFMALIVTRRPLEGNTDSWRPARRVCAGEVWRGGSWRLPSPVAQRLVTGPFLHLCNAAVLPAKFCMKNLLDTH
jgi:hypothetical protein